MQYFSKLISIKDLIADLPSSIYHRMIPLVVIRYFFGKIFINFIYTFTSILFLVMVIQIANIYNNTADLNIGYDSFLKIVALTTPYVSFIITPFSFFFAVWITMKSLIESNEMITIYISGLSTKVIIKSFYVICSILFIFLLILSNFIYPKSNFKINVIKYNVESSNVLYSIKPKTFFSMQDESIYTDKIDKEKGFIDMIIINRNTEDNTKYVSLSKLVKIYQYNNNIYVDSFNNKSFLFNTDDIDDVRVVDTSQTTSSLSGFLHENKNTEHRIKVSSLSTKSLFKYLAICRQDKNNCPYNVNKILKEINMRFSYPLYIYTIGLSAFLPFLKPMNYRLLKIRYHIISFGMFFTSLALSLVAAPQIATGKYYYINYVSAIAIALLCYFEFNIRKLFKKIKPPVFCKIFHH